MYYYCSMDAIGLISSVSRLAIAAFVITLIVVSYEVFLISRRKRQQPIVESHDVSIPEFQADARPGTFSPLVVDEVAKESFSLGSRRIPKSHAYVLLGLGIVAVMGAGFLIYKRSTLSSPDVKLSSISPTPRGGEQAPEPTDLLTGSPSGNSVTPGLRITLSPTPTSATTTEPSPTSTPLIVSPRPTGLLSNNLPTVSPTSTQTSPTAQPTSTISVTAKPTTNQLPQAGTYQNMLMLSLVSIAVIYLALIL